MNTGDRLPTVAGLAENLGVTASTVRRALEDLAQSGHVASHVGRGTFVAEPPSKSPPDSDVAPQRTFPPPEEMNRFKAARAARRLRTGITKSLEALMPLSQRPGMIQFTSGAPAADLIPEGALEALTRAAMKKGANQYAGYGDPMGMASLREALAERFKRRRLPVEADQILITCGSQQALALIAMHALEARPRIIFETPCFTGMPKFFSNLGHWVETVTRDLEGPPPDRLERFSNGPAPLLDTCPQLHNPMGTDMSVERQVAVRDWVKRQNGLLVADEVFIDLHFGDTEPTWPLYEEGLTHLAISGSLSKSFMGGLRIGWLVADRKRLQALAGMKRAMDLGGPPLMEGIALTLLESGQYDDHLPQAQAYYRRRRDAALEALERCMPSGVQWTTPQGGFHLWVELPEGYSSIALYLAAIERGVAVIPGPLADVDHRFVNAFRLSYGGMPPEQVTEGIERLAEATRELLRHPPGDSGMSGLGEFI